MNTELRDSLIRLSQIVSVVVDGDKRDEYDIALMDVITHPEWRGYFSLNNLFDTFMLIPTSENYAILAGAMAAYQGELYNL